VSSDGVAGSRAVGAIITAERRHRRALDILPALKGGDSGY